MSDNTASNWRRDSDGPAAGEGGRPKLAENPPRPRRHAARVPTSDAAGGTAASAEVRRVGDRPDAWMARVEARLEDGLADLERAAREIDATLDQRIERISREIGDRLDSRMQRLEARLEGGLADLERGAREIDAALDLRIEGLSRAISAMEDLSVRELPKRTQELDRSLASIETLVERLESGGEGLVTQAAGASRVLEEASIQLDETLERIESVGATLNEHRASLGSMLVEDRRALLEDVIARLASELSARARRRLAAEVAEIKARESERVQRVSPAPRAIAAPVRDTARAEMPDPVEAGDGDPALDPTAETEEFDGDDFATARYELIATVLEVRGIGPARAELLADAFGDLDELAGARVTDVVELTGLPRRVVGDVLVAIQS